MPFGFNEKSVFLLFPALLALIFAGLLAVQGYRSDQRSSLWLSAFLGLGSLYLAPFLFGYAGWYGLDGYRETLFYLPLQQQLLLGPVMYGYLRSLLDPAFRIQGRQWWHFLPAVLYLGYSLVVWITDVWVLQRPWFYADGQDKDLDFSYQMAGLISILGYFALSLRHYRSYRQLSLQVLSYAEAVSHRWIQRYLWVFVALLVLRVLFFIFNPEWGEFGSKFWYYANFSVMLMYISFTGYTHAIRMEDQFWRKGIENQGEWQAQLTAATEGPTATTEALPDLERWKAKLTTCMEQDRLFANPGLTLQEVASVIGANSRVVSSVVNQGFGLNFNDYVNNLRCEAVIALFKADQHQSHTLLAIALDSGFNSKSTFNRAFKKYTGLAPKTWLEGIKE